MTVINVSELSQLSTLDEGLMWSIMSITASNLDPRNNYISDNAAIRAESKDYVSWQLIQDDKGQGKFTFSALLPIVNLHPLQDKPSLLSRIWSYSPYDPSMIVDVGSIGWGWKIPVLPTWLDSTEQLLAVLAVLASKISQYALLTQGTDLFVESVKSEYWGNCQYQITDSPYNSQMIITGYLTIDWDTYLQGGSLIRCLQPYVGHASNVNCNFPDLAELWDLPSVDIDLPVAEILPLVPLGTHGFTNGGGRIMLAESSAEALIDSYNQFTFNYDAVPDWYRNAIDDNEESQQNRSKTPVVNNPDAETPQIIESLPICKEQDASIVSYGKSPLATILGK
jgi:hypothetical protein